MSRSKNDNEPVHQVKHPPADKFIDNSFHIHKSKSKENLDTENLDSFMTSKRTWNISIDPSTPDVAAFNISGLNEATPATPVAAAHSIQKAMQDLQSDIKKRKNELEEIQKSYFRRNGSAIPVRLMQERKSLFQDDLSILDASTQDDATNKFSFPSTRIPQLKTKTKLSPSSHGEYIAELSVHPGSSTANAVDQTTTDDLNYLQSNLDESFEEDEDKVKIRQIQSKNKVFYRYGTNRNRSPAPLDVSQEGDLPTIIDEDSNSSFLPSIMIGKSFVPAMFASSFINDSHHDTSRASIHDSSHVNNSMNHALKHVAFDDIVDQAVSAADHQIMSRLRSEQTRVAFLERRIEELEKENKFYFDKVSIISKSQQDAELEDAKINVWKTRIAELEKENIEQTQRVKSINLEKAKFEGLTIQLEEDLTVTQDELLLIRNQLQSKAMKLAALESEMIAQQRRFSQLENELDDAKRLIEEYETTTSPIENQFVLESQSNAIGVDVNHVAVEEKALDNFDVDFQEKISILSHQIDEITRDRDGYILKYAHAEEMLRQTRLEMDQLRDQYNLLKEQFAFIEHELQSATTVQKLPEPATPAPSDYDRAAQDALAEIEMQTLREQVKRSEKSLIVYKYFFKLRDHMKESQIKELQTLADVLESDRKYNEAHPIYQTKTIIKEVPVPIMPSYRTRIWNLIQLALLKTIVWLMILLCGYLFLVGSQSQNQRRQYRITS